MDTPIWRGVRFGGGPGLRRTTTRAGEQGNVWTPQSKRHHDAELRVRVPIWIRAGRESLTGGRQYESPFGRLAGVGSCENGTCVRRAVA